MRPLFALRNRVSLVEFASRDFLVRTALFWWTVVALIVIGRGLLAHKVAHLGVYAVYMRAGADWLAGQAVYPNADGFDIFRYHPLFAAGFAPFSQLPLWLGSMLWRALMVAVVVSSVRRWLAVRGTDRRSAAAVMLLIAPLVAWDLVDGQTNALIAAFLLRAVAAASEEKWWRASLWLAVSSLLKLYPLGFAALMMVARPRQLGLRVPAAIAILCAAPFLMQSPTHVAGMYGDWFATFTADGGRQHYPVSLSYRDLRFLFRVWSEPLPSGAFTGVAVAFWLASLGYIRLLATRANDPAGWRSLWFQALALGAIGMTVVGPCTEIGTYALLGPCLALATWEHRHYALRRTSSALFCLSYALLAAACLSFLFPFGSGFSMLGAQPFAAILFATGGVAFLLEHLRTPCPRPQPGPVVIL